MNCRFVQSRLSAYVDCELTGHEQQAIRVHLEHCLECSQEYETLRKTKSLMRQLPLVQPTTSPEWLLARLHQQNGVMRRSARWSWNQVRWWQFAGGLALISAFIAWDLRSDPDRSEIQLTETPTAPAFVSQPIPNFEPAPSPALPQVSSSLYRSSLFPTSSSPYIPTNSYWIDESNSHIVSPLQPTRGFYTTFGLRPR